MYNISGIYKITNTINKKCYIGQAKNIKNRWKGHINSLNNNKNPCIYLQHAWNKYGEKSFKFEIIKECNIKDLDDNEEYFIGYHSSYNRKYGYNLRLGGSISGFNTETRKKMSISAKNKPPISNDTRKKLIAARKKWKFTKQTIEKIRQSNLGKKHSCEAKEKMSKAKKGCTPWNKGIPMIAEQKEKLSKTKTGFKHSEFSKQKMSKSHKHKVLSQETKNKIGKFNKNKILSQETKEKISNSKKGNTPWNKGKITICQKTILNIINDINNNLTVQDIMLKNSVTRSRVYDIKRKLKNGEL